MLYKVEDVPNEIVAAPITVPTYTQYSTHGDEMFYEHGVSDVMTMIPGISLVGNQGAWPCNPLYGEPSFTQATLPMHISQPPPCTPVTQITPSYAHVPTVARVAPPVHDFAVAGPSMTNNLRVGCTPDSLGPFRPSRFQVETPFVNASSSLDADFRTSQFKK